MKTKNAASCAAVAILVTFLGLSRVGGVQLNLQPESCANTQCSETEEWKPLDVHAWQTWLVPMYIDAVRNTARLNRDGRDSSHAKPMASKARSLVQELSMMRAEELTGVADELEALIANIRTVTATQTQKSAAMHSTFDFPVFVMNLPSRPDKRAHMECLVSSLGFSNVSFPLVTRAGDLKFEEAVARGVVTESLIDTILQENDQAIHRVGRNTAMAYIANALDQLDVIQQAHEAGFPMFAVFEDDLVMSGSATSTQRTIAEAIQQLPPSADMLYLEACYEQCDASTFNQERPRLMRLRCPSCSAAIIYTAKGAKRVLDSCLPVFHGIDVMFPKLIETQQLEAYLALPQPFFQDSFWGSDAMREVASGENRRFPEQQNRSPRGHEEDSPGAGINQADRKKQEGSGLNRTREAAEAAGPRQHAVFTPTCYESIAWVLDDTELRDVALFVGREERDGREGRVMILREIQSPGGWQMHEGSSVVYYTPSWDDMIAGNGKFSVEVAKWRSGADEVRLWIPQESNCFESNVGVCRLELVLEDAEGGEHAVLQRYVVLDWGELAADPNPEWQSPLRRV